MTAGPVPTLSKAILVPYFEVTLAMSILLCLSVFVGSIPRCSRLNSALTVEKLGQGCAQHRAIHVMLLTFQGTAMAFVLEDVDQRFGCGVHEGEARTTF